MATKHDMSFDNWFSVVVVLVLEGSGVDFSDEDSVRQDYESGKDAHDVADEIIAEYN